MFVKENFCTRLKNQRLKRNLTQSQVGLSLNISKQNISRWEKGIREPNMSTLYELADYFDVSADYLLGRTDNPNSHKN